jgi:Glycosyltransferase
MEKDSNLILLTNTYPYGTGETFLDDEIKYLAKRFNTIFIFPLYTQSDKSNSYNIRCVPNNVIIKDPLLKCNHKSKIGLIRNGAFNTSPLGFAIKDFFKDKVYTNAKRFHIFFNYLLLLRAILSNKRRFKEIKEISSSTSSNCILYSYWGDKSALIIPFIKKEINCKCVVRFHGSDIFEEAKGYLPFRRLLYPSIDYAIPISNAGKEYIIRKYPDYLPKNIMVFRLGSINPFNVINNIENNESKPFEIVSCSNLIPLKRVELIADAIGIINKSLKIHWTHIGGGPLLNQLKETCIKNNINADFKGILAHNEVLNFYNNNNIDLFLNVSSSEGIPVSIMEAISFGIPTIATDVGGTNELFSTDTKRFLLPKNLTSSILADAILKFIAIPNSDKEHIHKYVRLEWEKNWNADKNYTKFVDFLYNINY